MDEDDSNLNAPEPAAQSAETTSPLEKPPDIGGLLVLWTIGLVLYPIRFAAAIYETYLPLLGLRPNGVLIGTVFRLVPQRGALVVLGAGLDITAFCTWMMLVSAFFARASSTRRLMVTLLLLQITESVFSLSISGSSTSEVNKEIVGGIVFPLLWLPYVLRSDRVKKTFLSGPVSPFAVRSAVACFVVLFVAFGGLTMKSHFQDRAAVAADPALEFQGAIGRDPEVLGWSTSVEAKATARGLAGAEKDAFEEREGAELVARGLLRLPDAQLRRRAFLIGKMLDNTDEKTCAMRGRAQITYGALLKLLPTPELREWYEISKAAMFAEIRALVPAISVDGGRGIVDHYSAALTEAEQRRMRQAVTKDAPYSETCWAVRWMYRTGLAAIDGVDAKPYVRWLALQ